MWTHLPEDDRHGISYLRKTGAGALGFAAIAYRIALGTNTIWTSAFVGGLADRSSDPEGAELARLMRPHLDPPDSECEAAVRSALCR